MRASSTSLLALVSSSCALLLACQEPEGRIPDEVSLGPGDDGPPCEEDLLGCGSGEALEPDPACTLEGELSFELGNGEAGTFSPLGPGETPKTTTGFQGGWHTWLGVRVTNPAFDSPGIEISIDLLECYGGCEAEDASFEPVYSRRLVSEGRELDGGILVTDILYVWYTEPYGVSGNERWRLEVSVRDRCGREGSLSHEFDAPT